MQLKERLDRLVSRILEESKDEIPLPKLDSEFAAYCDMKKIHPVKAMKIWELARHYGTWDLGLMMAEPPSPLLIKKTKAAVEDMMDTLEWERSRQ